MKVERAEKLKTKQQEELEGLQAKPVVLKNYKSKKTINEVVPPQETI